MKLTIKSLERKEIQTPRGPTPTAIKISIQANEISGNRWASVFENAQTKAWKPGDVVEIDRIEEKGKYLNIILIKNHPAPGVSSGGGDAVAILRSIDDGIKLLGVILQRIEAQGNRPVSTRSDESPVDDGGGLVYRPVGQPKVGINDGILTKNLYQQGQVCRFSPCTPM